MLVSTLTTPISTITSTIVMLVGVIGLANAQDIAIPDNSEETRANCQPWQSSFATRPELLVGPINISTKNVFDTTLPEEQQWYHELTNLLHLPTRSRVIAYQLLFKTGDRYSEAQLEDSARLLRSNRSIRSASVKPVSLCGNRVTIDVITEDHWTLTPSVAYKQAGGVNSLELELQELNLFGLNKEIKFAYESTRDDTETLFQYRDKNLLGSRYTLALAYETLNGRDAWQIGFGLPFFNDNAKYTWGFIVEDARKLSREVRVNDRRALSQKSRAEAWYLHKLQLNGAIYRVGGGWRAEQELYTVDGSVSTATQDFEYEYTYPYLAFQYLEPEYITRQNIYSIGRVEDIDTGFRFALETGFITEELGNNDNLVRLGMTMGNGWTFGDKTLGVVEFSLRDYLTTDRYSIGFKATAFQLLDKKNLLQLDLHVQRRKKFSADHHFAIGGEAGLKGFPDQHQRGNQRVIGAVEFRHLLDYYPFRLFRMAISGFYEVGAAWTAEQPRNWLHNIGAGLAVSPTRTSTHDLLRFDIAIPVTDTENINAYQVYIGTQIRY
ncbi:MAG: hypothetical protein KTR33_17055 [Gammaproteobacteria bacterium]|nr:hypothetical protein [Gammaproteobacteria bacterium]